MVSSAWLKVKVEINSPLELALNNGQYTRPFGQYVSYNSFKMDLKEINQNGIIDELAGVSDSACQSGSRVRVRSLQN